MKNRIILYLHLAFWAYMLMQQLFPALAYSSTLDPVYYIILPVDLFISVVLFYGLYLYVFPWLFRFRVRALAFLVGLVIVVAYAALSLGIFYYYEKLLHLIPPEQLIITRADILTHVRGVIVILIYSLLIRIIANFLNQQQKEAELVQQNQASEIALLRSQINPHFLFNTLNNIYSLIRNHSKDADTAVMKLSEIMRYMLYESNAEKVPLTKEIEYLHGFIELQKLRLEDPDYVVFDIQGNLASRNIAPMILIPFVENAFKHGGRKGVSPGISIQLVVTDSQIVFQVDNTKPRHPRVTNDSYSGIGLNNIRRRLLLIYPKTHHLEIKDEPEMFRVTLVIDN